MEENLLIATRREVIGKMVKAYRKQGKLPAVLYGRHVEPTPIWLDLRETSRILSQMHSSTLLTVDLEGEKHLTLVREKQRNFIYGTLTHVDFQAVSMLEKIRTEVTVNIIGEAPAVKNFDGVLVVNMESLEVECLPQDLPEVINIDISGLSEIGRSFTVKDVVISDKVTIFNDKDEVIVVVTAQAVEEVEEVVEEEVEAIEPELVVKGKKEVAEPEVVAKGKKEEE